MSNTLTCIQFLLLFELAFAIICSDKEAEAPKFIGAPNIRLKGAILKVSHGESHLLTA